MSYGSSSIDSGPSPDLAVHRDLITGVNYPTTKLIDATEGSTTPIGTTANPLKTRVFQRGSQAFDTGLVELPTSTTQVTAASIFVQTIFVHNGTTSVRKVTMSDDASTGFRFNEAELLPKATVALMFHAAEQAGLRWHADGAGVYAQVEGEQ